jgi:hypothetical protein
MSVGSWLLWGFAATVVLTTIMAGSQRLGLTRMNIPYMLGTLVTPNRDRAKILGIAIHLVNGFLFSLIYVAAFHSWGSASIGLGALVGLVHALFVLAVGLPALPGMHPRMASESHGPEAVEQLEPPGFFGMHYGVQTPLSVLVAHLVFGGILGAFYGGV